MASSHVHFVQSLEPLQGGGLGVAARQLHHAMVTAGSDSHLFATCDRSFTESWPKTTQCVRTRPAKAFYAPGLMAAGAAAVDCGSIVHGHGFYVYPNWVFGRLARLRRACLVYHAHGFFEPWILARARWKKRMAHWLFEDANFKHVRLWRALTCREADQIRSLVGDGAKVVIAPNGIEAGSNKKATFSRASGRKRALFLGRLHPKKGLDLLLQAMARARDSTRDWELVIAGPDEGGHEAQVRAWVRSAGLDHIVKFCGPVSGAAKFDLIASADLFILTSYSEGLPMAPLEAMAAGVPVLLTHECNLPGAAATGAGWFSPADAGLLVKSVSEAFGATDGELRQRGEAGRKLVERDFSWEKTVATLQEACQQLV